MLSERCIEVQKDLCFIDYQKTFDNVKRVELLKYWKNCIWMGKIERMLQNLY